jgi:hypothetical protein
MRILIDMDEVIADAIERFLEWYERDFGVRYKKGRSEWHKAAHDRS